MLVEEHADARCGCKLQRNEGSAENTARRRLTLRKRSSTCERFYSTERTTSCDGLFLQTQLFHGSRTDLLFIPGWLSHRHRRQRESRSRLRCCASGSFRPEQGKLIFVSSETSQRSDRIDSSGFGLLPDQKLIDAHSQQMSGLEPARFWNADRFEGYGSDRSLRTRPEQRGKETFRGVGRSGWSG